jgi:hypothetical protein
LGVPNVTPSEATAVQAALPTNSTAARFYADGLAKLRVFDALGAQRLLEKAIAAEPDYRQAHAALASVWSALGYDGKAADEAKQAFALSCGLLREGQLKIEALYRRRPMNGRRRPRILTSAVAEAKKHAPLGYEFEARLALGEADARLGEISGARSRLHALQNEAAAKGFVLIASKADLAGRAF